MYKLSEQEFAEYLFGFQVVTSAHLLVNLKEISATDSIKKILELSEKYVVNELVNVKRPSSPKDDENGFKELYEHYLRRFSEKKYLEIDQYLEEEDVLDE